MKIWTNIVVALLFFVFGMCIDTMINNCISVKLYETSGVVTSITKDTDNTIVTIQTKCWHAGDFNYIKLVTDKDYQIGDTINFK